MPDDASSGNKDNDDNIENDNNSPTVRSPTTSEKESSLVKWSLIICILSTFSLLIIGVYVLSAWLFNVQLVTALSIILSWMASMLFIYGSIYVIRKIIRKMWMAYAHVPTSHESQMSNEACRLITESAVRSRNNCSSKLQDWCLIIMNVIAIIGSHFLLSWLFGVPFWTAGQVYTSFILILILALLTLAAVSALMDKWWMSRQQDDSSEQTSEE